MHSLNSETCGLRCSMLGCFILFDEQLGKLQEAASNGLKREHQTENWLFATYPFFVRGIPTTHTGLLVLEILMSFKLNFDVI